MAVEGKKYGAIQSFSNSKEHLVMELNWYGHRLMADRYFTKQEAEEYISMLEDKEATS